MVCANATCCHKLPLISFWNTTGQHTLQIKHILSNMLYKSGSGWTFQHVWIGSMRFSILRYAEEIVTRCCWLWVILQGILRHFKGRMLWCVFFPPNWKTAMLFWIEWSGQKEIQILAFERCTVILSAGQWQQTKLNEQRSKFHRRSVGVHFGRPATFLDAANMIKRNGTKLLMKLSKYLHSNTIQQV